jgi:hypothetical protein
LSAARRPHDGRAWPVRANALSDRLVADALALTFLSSSTTVGAIHFIVTILRHRPLA